MVMSSSSSEMTVSSLLGSMVEVMATSLILVTFCGLIAVALRLRLFEFDFDFAMVCWWLWFQSRLDSSWVGSWMSEDFVLPSGKVSSPPWSLWVSPSQVPTVALLLMRVKAERKDEWRH